MALKTGMFLRRAERDDMDTVVTWMDDPDFLHFLYGDPVRSPKQIREHLTAVLGRNAPNTVPSGMYLIVESSEHGPVGLVSIMNISWRNRSCSLDAYIGNKSLRSGMVAGISLYRAMEFCFDELNLHRITTYIYSFNSPSWRLMELSGAKRELVMRHHVPRDGKLYDLYAYGLLRREFEALRERQAARFKGKSLAEMIAAQQEALAQAETAP
ncbi:MAG TPA: GNAT family protein [Candidatus Hydrogenedentes bacterium]|nr:GNAT family protein [Candidatus Hydrogenedentota bacterium]